MAHEKQYDLLRCHLLNENLIWGLVPGGGWEFFLFTTTSGAALGPAQPPVRWVPGALSLGMRRPVREADHPTPSSAEVKNAWSYNSTPQYAFMAWCLVKHRDIFTFTYNKHNDRGFL
jgi:hypothetical protein